MLKGTTFKKEFHIRVVYYHSSDPDLHNENPFRDFIRKVRRKWCKTMVNKRLSSQLWYYVKIWVSEVMSMTHSPENSVNGGIPLKNVTGDTVDISKYLDSSFC